MRKIVSCPSKLTNETFKVKLGASSNRHIKDQVEFALLRL